MTVRRSNGDFRWVIHLCGRTGLLPHWPEFESVGVWGRCEVYVTCYGIVTALLGHWHDIHMTLKRQKARFAQHAILPRNHAYLHVAYGVAIFFHRWRVSDELCANHALGAT